MALSGESTSEVFPRLAGQHAEYIAKQLAAFQSGQRKSTAMAPMVEKLTPDEMLALGRYYEKLSVPREEPKNPQLAAVGRYIFTNGNPYSGVPACASCHGTTAQGAANLPRLASLLSHEPRCKKRQHTKSWRGAPLLLRFTHSMYAICAESWRMRVRSTRV